MGSKDDKEESEYLHRGLAQRSFERAWTISDDTIVKDVVFQDGLLTIGLGKVVPEHHARKDYLWYNVDAREILAAVVPFGSFRTGGDRKLPFLLLRLWIIKVLV